MKRQRACPARPARKLLQEDGLDERGPGPEPERVPDRERGEFPFGNIACFGPRRFGRFRRGCMRDARPKGRDGGGRTRRRRQVEKRCGNAGNRRWPGAVGHSCTVPYCARSPAPRSGDMPKPGRSSFAVHDAEEAKRPAGTPKTNESGRTQGGSGRFHSPDVTKRERTGISSCGARPRRPRSLPACCRSAATRARSRRGGRR